MMFNYDVTVKSNETYFTKRFKSEFFAKIYANKMRKKKTINEVLVCTSFR